MKVRVLRDTNLRQGVDRAPWATFLRHRVVTPTTPLQPGHNRIAVHDRTKTSNVLVWISTLGTTDGESRMEISEITLQAAA